LWQNGSGLVEFQDETKKCGGAPEFAVSLLLSVESATVPFLNGSLIVFIR